MIINPIIPIWFMTFICLCFLLLLFYNSKKIFKYIIEVYKEKKLKKSRTLFAFISKFIVKILIIILLFLINLRFMLPNGEVDAVTSDLSILFVIDTSVSMRALDYNGENERFKGVINDCEYILDNLPNSKYSIITFGDTARRIIPFTTDVDIVKAELKAIQLENDFYAKGTSLNLVKNILEKTVKDEYERQSGNTKTLVFFISDGEITIEGEKLEDLTPKEKIDLTIKHLNYLSEIKPEKVAVLEMRTHAAWYIKGLKESKEIKLKIFKCESKEELLKILLEYKAIL